MVGPSPPSGDNFLKTPARALCREFRARPFPSLVHAKARSREVTMLINDALDAFFESGRTKIDQESQRQPHQPEVCQQLLGMNGREMLDGFQFYYQASLNDQVGSKSLVEPNSLELDWDWDLPRDTEAPILEEPSEDHFVHGLQKTRAQLTVEMERDIHDH